MTRMRLDVFCGWGDGPDVGINAVTADADWRLLGVLDLTADEADVMADHLRACAQRARELDALCAARDQHQEKSP